jgi:recombination protein RecA
MYGKGVSREGGVLDIGVDNDIVKKSGAWYTYEGEQLGQGRENAKQFLQENPEIMIEISERIRTQMGIGVDPEADSAGTTIELDPDDQPITLDD